MKLGVENKKQVAVLAVVGTLGIASLVYVYTSLAGGDAPAPAAAPIVTSKPVAPVAKAAKSSSGVAANVGTTAAELDPTLKMGRMLATEALVYTGSGRNIFSPASMPIEIPKPVAAVRPKPLPPPPPPQPVGPPPPPPIDLKFFGTATSGDGKRQAFLLKGDDVFLASDGDVVQRRYKVITVSANSVLVEDMTNNNRQTLPLLR
ncbi:MAG TPA: hypothetical protein VF214_07785 [Edaphobacter sp.]